MEREKAFRTCRWFALGAICAGAFGMFYCSPIILMEPVEVAQAVGLPFLSAALLYAVGTVCLTHIRVSQTQTAA